MKKPKILVITDVGRDVDDVLALSILEALQNAGMLEVVGVVTTHMIPEIRGRISRLITQMFGRKIALGSGSTYPLGREGEQELLHQYLEEHKIRNHSYEGIGLEKFSQHTFAVFRKSHEVILNAIAEHENIYIMVLAPMTDLAKAVLHNTQIFKSDNLSGVFIQGNAKVEDGKLIPDPVAYNIAEDIWAAEIVFEKLSGIIPFTFLGKWAAYSAPLKEEDFQRFADTDHPVGRYLQTTARNGLKCFALRLPKVYSNLYAGGKDVDPRDPIKDATHLSNPYDPSTILALTHPELFILEKEGIHTLIGMSKEESGVVNPETLHATIIEQIISGLTAASRRLKQEKDRKYG